MIIRPKYGLHKPALVIANEVKQSKNLCESKAYGSLRPCALRGDGVLQSIPKLLLAACLTCAHAQAQVVPPDAGVLRQQIESLRELPAPRRVAPSVAAPAPAPAAPAVDGVRVTVKRFVVEGNTLIDKAALEALVRPFAGQTLNFSQIEAVAVQVGQLYRQAGWVARVYLPLQEVDQGVVTIQVVEAIFGRLIFEGPASQRLSQEQVRRIIYAQQAPGSPLRQDRLDRGYLIASDLGAVEIRATMREGQTLRTTDVVVQLTDKPLFNVSLSGDNFGAVSTGQYRTSANASLVSLAGMGDLLSASVTQTEGSDYYGLSYQAPLGSAGWRLGLSASQFDYRLISPEMLSLKANGSASTVSLDATYPLVRALQRNLYLSLNAQAKTFDNQIRGFVSTQYSINTLTGSLNANAYDSWGAGGFSTAGLSWVGGRVNLDGSPNQADDAKTTRTQGEFWKLRVNAARQQTLNSQTALYLAYLGQVASKNLDGSEKLYLGGASGVRAYPANEAGGSQGQMINLELRTRWPNNLSLSGFYDWGRVWVNRDNNYPGANANNERTLQGAGLALAWQPNAKVVFKATWARRIGRNPAPTATGADQDGTLQMDRFWLTASLAL